MSSGGTANGSTTCMRIRGNSRHKPTEDGSEGDEVMGWNPDEGAKKIDKMKQDEKSTQEKAIRQQKAIQDAIARKNR